MISNQILQSTIEGLKNISRADMAIMDMDGKEIAATCDMRSYAGGCIEFVNSAAHSQELQGCRYFKIFDEGQLEYILVIKGIGEENYMIGKMVAFQIESLMIAYRERFDKDNFVKNLLLDNLLLVDIYSRCKKLRMATEKNRTVMLIQAANFRDVNMLELMKASFGAGSREFITAVDEKDVIILKDLAENENNADIDRYAKGIIEQLTKDGAKGVRISYGTTVHEIKDVSRSYKEAKMAVDVGKIFFEGKQIIAYNELGIGRLIYQLPIPLCKMFIREIFGSKNPDDFDEEMLTTIYKFFENSLNVSETSRQLFIHRNTLVYRLDKLQKITGLDIREFEDAITFRIALMVVKYMKYMENMDD